MNERARCRLPAAFTRGGFLPRPIVQYSSVLMGTRRYKAASDNPYIGSSKLSCVAVNLIDRASLRRYHDWFAECELRQCTIIGWMLSPMHLILRRSCRKSNP